MSRDQAACGHDSDSHFLKPTLPEVTEKAHAVSEGCSSQRNLQLEVKEGDERLGGRKGRLAKKAYEKLNLHKTWGRGDLEFKNQFETKSNSKRMEQARGARKALGLFLVSHWLLGLTDSPHEENTLQCKKYCDLSGIHEIL